MKKFLLATTAAGAALAISAPASAGNYVKLFGGTSAMGGQKAQLRTFNETNSVSYYSSLAGGTPVYSYLVYDPRTSASSPSSSSYITATWGWWGSWSVLSGTATRFTHEETHIDYSFDTGFVIGAAIGKNLTKHMSAEIEFSARRNNFNAVIDYFDSYLAYGSGTYHTATFYYQAYYYYHFYYNSSYASSYWWNSGYSSAAGSYWTYWNYGSGPYTGPFTMSGSGSRTDQVSGTLTSWAIMANVWFDMNPDGDIHPFVGAGIGMAKVKMDMRSVGEVSDQGIAWQYGAGVGFDIGDNSQVTLEYRHFDASDVELIAGDWDMGIEYEVDEFLVGFKFNF